jgi:CubicO group peptidase (beta-lactamase class C family)
MPDPRHTPRSSSTPHLHPGGAVGRAVLFLLVATVGGVAPLAGQQTPLQGLESFVEEGMAEWGIPGLAMAVVKDNQVVMARGFGVLHREEERQVDEHTLFGVASVSKAFTAAAVAMLVDEGRLHWDDPVVKHLPGFRLYDPFVTETVTVRDLLSHRVGVGRMTGNRITWLPHRDRSDLVYRIRYLEPEQSFRNGYVYSNVMYMVAGELVAAVSGMSWDEFVARRIFEPLGMDRSNTSVTAIADGENAAWPHQEIDGEVVPIPRRNFDAVGPSASINTSVSEITAWMRLHLGTPGEVDGVRLLSPEVMREMHRAQNRIPDGGPPGGLVSYGLGWQLSSFEGRRISQHGGATDGMNTTLVLVPEENLGVIVTTNTFNNFMAALANRVLDRYLGVEDRPWDRMIRDAFEAQYARVAAGRDSIHAARVTGTSPSLPLDAYTGLFVDSLYAEARVRRGGGQAVGAGEADGENHGGLVLEFWEDETQTLALEHWHHDTFRGHWRNPAQREKFVWFTRGDDGSVDALHVRWTLRPDLLQVGLYPASYTRTTTFRRVESR